jgi:hypothetical protein
VGCQTKLAKCQTAAGSGKYQGARGKFKTKRMFIWEKRPDYAKERLFCAKGQSGRPAPGVKFFCLLF